MTAETVRTDEKAAQTAIQACLDARRDHRDIFALDPVIPEQRFIDAIKEIAKRTGDPRLPLNALFAVLTCDFSQQTKLYFKRFENSELLATNYWLFQPEKVAKAINDGVNVPEKYLTLLGLDQKYYGKAVIGIAHNFEVLHREYEDDIGVLLKKSGNDAEQIYNTLVVRNRAKTVEKKFWRYGSKIAPYFFQLANQYGLAKIENIGKVGLPVDFQLARFLIQTEAIDFEGEENAFQVISNYAVPLFKKLCETNGWETQIVSETIWLVCSNLYSQNYHELCPVREICQTKVDSEMYYRRGKFSKGKPWKKVWQEALM